jgi:hypothetical protein
MSPVVRHLRRRIFLRATVEGAVLEVSEIDPPKAVRWSERLINMSSRFGFT